LDMLAEMVENPELAKKLRKEAEQLRAQAAVIRQQAANEIAAVRANLNMLAQALLLDRGLGKGRAAGGNPDDDTKWYDRTWYDGNPYAGDFSWGCEFAKDLAWSLDRASDDMMMDMLVPERVVNRMVANVAADYDADRGRGLGTFDAGLNAFTRNAPLLSAGWGLGEAIQGKVEGGVNHGQSLNAGERIGRIGNFIATEGAAGTWAAARWIPRYGATPQGRPFTKHYGTETGPIRNIPGSVIDNTINTTEGVAGRGGSTVYYDPGNDVTVVTGDRGIMSARRRPPGKG